MTADIVTPAMLRFERRLRASPERVWEHLVDPELRARWFMASTSEDLRAGGRIGFTIDHDRLSDTRAPMPERYRAHVGHSWTERVTRFDPPRLIAFTWEDGGAGEVTIELEAAEGGTRLVLTHTGLRGRDDALDFGGGWRSHLAALDRRAAGDTVPDFWVLHAEAQAAIAQALP